MITVTLPIEEYEKLKESSNGKDKEKLSDITTGLSCMYRIFVNPQFSPNSQRESMERLFREFIEKGYIK